MKSYCFFFLLIIVLLSSCSDDEHGRELYNRINPIILENPDSALRVLAGMSSHIDDSDEAMMNYYTLLTIKAKDKAYIVHQSDSAILSILPYFEKHTERLPEVYYYVGRVYSDMGDAPEALSYFQKALDLLPEESHSADELKLKSVIFTQLGVILRHQYLFEDSRSFFMRAFTCDSLLNDTSYMVSSLIDVGNSYRETNAFDSTMYFYQTAKELCMKSDMHKDMANVLVQEAKLCYDLKQYEKALAFLSEIRDSYSESVSSIDAMKAVIYTSMSANDSASFYWHKVLDSGTLYMKTEAYAGLANIEMSKRNLNLATQYINKYLEYSDSTRKILQIEAVINANKFYNYQHKQKEINALKLQNIRKNYSIVIVVCILTIILLLFYSIVRYMRVKQLNTDIQVARYQRLLAKLESKAQTQGTLQKEDDENQLLMSNLLCRINLLLEREKIMNDDDWCEAKRVIEIVFPCFFSSLYELRFLNETDMHISMLLKLGFVPNVIAKLIGRDKSTITASRKKIAQRAFGQERVAKDWDTYIDSL